MEPYYEDELVTLYHGDCREVTEWLDADVLVTDPPYGVKYANRRGQTIANDQDFSAAESALDLWGRRGPVAIFANHQSLPFGGAA